MVAGGGEVVAGITFGATVVGGEVVAVVVGADFGACVEVVTFFAGRSAACLVLHPAVLVTIKRAITAVDQSVCRPRATRFRGRLGDCGRMVTDIKTSLRRVSTTIDH